MKILFLTNNEIAIPLRDWIRDVAGEKVVTLQKRLTTELISNVKPDLTISYNYRFLITQTHIDLLSQNVINLHTSLLPWNRGAAPNVWSFLRDTPKGVSIHAIDAGLDTGGILVQKELRFDEEKETLSSSYQTLHVEIQELFKSCWSEIRSCSLPVRPQIGTGSTQTLADFESIKHILDPEGWRVPIATLKGRYGEILPQLARGFMVR